MVIQGSLFSQSLHNPDLNIYIWFEYSISLHSNMVNLQCEIVGDRRPICQFNFPICGWKQIYSENSSPPTPLLSLIFMGCFSGFAENQFDEWKEEVTSQAQKHLEKVQMCFWGLANNQFDEWEEEIRFQRDAIAKKTSGKSALAWCCCCAAKIYFSRRQNNTRCTTFKRKQKCYFDNKLQEPSLDKFTLVLHGTVFSLIWIGESMKCCSLSFGNFVGRLIPDKFPPNPVGEQIRSAVRQLQ